jgi:hypothetical protein
MVCRFFEEEQCGYRAAVPMAHRQRRLAKHLIGKCGIGGAFRAQDTQAGCAFVYPRLRLRLIDFREEQALAQLNNLPYGFVGPDTGAPCSILQFRTKKGFGRSDQCPCTLDLVDSRPRHVDQFDTRLFVPISPNIAFAKISLNELPP